MVREFEKRKNFIVKAVSGIPGVEVDVPDGAFYIFPDVSSFFGKKADGKVIENADDLCMYLLEKGLVSTVTGSAFGEPTCIRMSYAASMEKLQDGVDRISRALAALN
jgi:aspartate aminotransferase